MLITRLHNIAKNDTETAGYPKEEHTCWIAAIRIQELEAMIAGKNDAQLLHEIATRLWRKEQNERIMAHPTELVEKDRPDFNAAVYNSKKGIEGNGTG